MSELPETMFRTTTFDDWGPDEPLKPWRSRPLDESADDQWYASDSVPAWTRPEGVCPAFQWIGQPFTSCDRCGQPFWDHTHDEHPAERSDPFSVRVRHEYISQERRDAVRIHWTEPLATTRDAR